MFWLFMLKNRIKFSQDNSITNETMSKLLMANLKVQQTRHIGFYGAGISHFECCWIALGAKPRVDQDKLSFVWICNIYLLSLSRQAV